MALTTSSYGTNGGGPTRLGSAGCPFARRLPGGGPRLLRTALLTAAIAFMPPACAPEPDPPPSERAFVARNTVEILKELAPKSPVVATLNLGTGVEIVGRRRRFVRVKTQSGVEGWTQDSKLITPEVRELMEQLRAQTASDPPQGKVHAFRTLNVHLEPHRWSPTIYQLQEEEGADLLRHELVERLPHKPERGKPPPAPTGLDDWYLVRLSNGQPGWVLTTGVYSGIPDEVKQYAERRRIVAYLPLGEVELRSGEAKKTWLWTQISHSKQAHDFDLIRVFMWSRRRGAYQTIKIERGLTGYLPVVFYPRVEAKRGTGPGFSVVVSKKGERVQRTYVHLKYRVYRVDEKPAKSPQPIRFVRERKPPPPPSSLMDRVLSWWKNGGPVSELKP